MVPRCWRRIDLDQKLKASNELVPLLPSISLTQKGTGSSQLGEGHGPMISQTPDGALRRSALPGPPDPPGPGPTSEACRARHAPRRDPKPRHGTTLPTRSPDLRRHGKPPRFPGQLFSSDEECFVVRSLLGPQNTQRLHKIELFYFFCFFLRDRGVERLV